MGQNVDLDLDAQSFDTLYDTIITPAVLPFETERQALVKWFWTLMAGAAAVTAVAAVIAWIMFRQDNAVRAALLIFVGALAFGFQRINGFKKRCKAAMLGRLAETIGMTYSGEVTPTGFDRLKELGLMPRHEEAKFDDLFTGHRQDCDFQLYEAKLVSRKDPNHQRKRKVVFRGQIIRLVFPKKFLGVTVVNREGVRWSKPGFQRVGLGASSFEKRFEVYGTDQIEARFLVHPAFMERLIALESAAAGRGARCAFADGELMIAVEGGDLFEVAHAFKPMPDRTLIHKGISELKQVMALIDVVMAPPPKAYG